jgi:hypothetical protein
MKKIADRAILWWRVAAVSKMSLDGFSVPLPCHAVAVMLHAASFDLLA